MPIYEFECRGCSARFELLMASTSAVPRCPACSSREVDKLFSTFGCKTGDGFTAAGGGKGCGSCSSHNCASCH